MGNYDLIVIGAGPGGYVAAIRAAQKGLKTAVVEKEHVGGCCLNRGCIPTKSLMHAAHLYREMKHASRFGLKVEGMGFDIGQMYANKNETVATLRGGVEQLLKANKVDLYRGTAAITGPNAVVVRGEEEVALEAKNLLIATGGRPSLLPEHLQNIEGVYTSDDILAEDPKLFKRITIIGAGVIALEFASLYSDLGCEVTIVVRSSVLRKMDREISQNLSMIMKKRGIRIETGALLKDIEKTPDGLVCTFTQKDADLVVECDALIAAMGRQATTEELFEGWDGVAHDGCAVVIDENFQTSVPGIYAIGDCTVGSTQLAHMASAEGMNAVSHMIGEKMAVDLATVPSCIYTDPEIATAGLSADEAKEAGIDTVVGKYIMTGNGKSMLSGQERGFVKLVYNSENHQLIGAQLMCARATDMIGELAMAISNKLTQVEMAQVVHPHPTYVEGIWEATEDVEKLAIHIAPKLKR